MQVTGLVFQGKTLDNGLVDMFPGTGSSNTGKLTGHDIGHIMVRVRI